MSNIAKEEYLYVQQNQKVPVNNRLSYLAAKRFVDIVGSLAGIILLSLLFLIVAALIKLEDPKGSIFSRRKESEKTAGNLTCINSAQWSPMLKKSFRSFFNIMK